MSYEYMHPQAKDVSTVHSVDQLRELIMPLVRARGMRSASLFGSYARGEATAESDIDLVVDKGPARYLSVCGLSGDIYEATGKLPDVYDISELLPGPFRDAVLREAVAL